MAIAARLRQTLVIERATAGTVNGWGHAAQAWADLATTPGLVQERAGREVTGPQLEGTVIADALIFLPAGTAVIERDRIRNAATGRRYELLFVRDPGARGRHLQVDARRVGA